MCNQTSLRDNCDLQRTETQTFPFSYDTQIGAQNVLYNTLYQREQNDKVDVVHFVTKLWRSKPLRHFKKSQTKSVYHQPPVLYKDVRIIFIMDRNIAFISIYCNKYICLVKTFSLIYKSKKRFSISIYKRNSKLHETFKIP